MHSLLERPTGLWRRHPLGVGLTAGLVAMLVLGLGAGLTIVLLRPAHAAPVTDTSCTSSSYAADLTTASTSGDVITFDCPSDAVINVRTSSGGPGTVTVPAGFARIIRNTGAYYVTLDGELTTQLFVVQSTGSLTLDNLNLSGGSVTSSGAGGGGVDNEGGTVTIIDSSIGGNQANGIDSSSGGGFDARGGGLYNNSTGTVTIAHSSFTNNGATVTEGGTSIESGPGQRGKGGGLYNLGTLTITDSIFSYNHVNGLVFGGEGGAIDNEGGTVTITGSTFSNNQASGNAVGPGGLGGALFSSGTATITNSTIAGNQANGGMASEGDGGGLMIDGGTATITNSTIYGNQTGASLFGPGKGGGVYTALGTATITNSIVAANDDTGGNLPNCGNAGTLTDGGYNLEESSADPSADCGFTAANHDQLAVSVAALHMDGLNLLSPNGGFTPTLALAAGSPAIDNANLAICTNTSGSNPVDGVDQRGVTRPQGAGCDIGAYELELPTAALSAGSPRFTDSAVTYVTGAASFTLTGADVGPGILSVSYCIYPQGGSCTGSFTTINGKSAKFSLGTSRADAAYTIAYYATDGLSNQGATQTAAFTLDNTAPAATLSIGQPQASVNGQTEVTSNTPLTLSATDVGSGVASVSYRSFPKGAAAPALTTVSGDTATFKLTGADGVYEVDYDAADHLGNDPAQTVFITLANGSLLNGADVANGGNGSGGAPPSGANGGPNTGAQATAVAQANGGAPGSRPGSPATTQPGPQRPPATGLPIGPALGLGALLLLLVLGGGGYLYARAQRSRRG